MQNDFLYQPYYCEENIWQLAKQLDEKNGEIWFIINPHQTIAIAQQKTAESDSFIIWDYHVIYYSPERGIFDLDTRCPFPYPADSYLQASFLDIATIVSAEYTPAFRVIPAKEYLNLFSSDRKHMLDEKGNFMQPPPDWPTIGKGHNLADFVDYHDQQFGNIYSLNQLIAKVSTRS